jgi:hypothetical protein
MNETKHTPIMCDRFPAQSRDASAGRASSDLYVDLELKGSSLPFAAKIEDLCSFAARASAGADRLRCHHMLPRLGCQGLLYWI